MMRQCSLVDRFKLFKGTCCSHFEGKALLYPEIRGRIFIRNVDIHLPNYTASHPRQEAIFTARNNHWNLKVTCHIISTDLS